MLARNPDRAVESSSYQVGQTFFFILLLQREHYIEIKFVLTCFFFYLRKQLKGKLKEKKKTATRCSLKSISQKGRSISVAEVS